MVNGSWGGVCDDDFSFNEAHVVCRQLGYDLGAEQVNIMINIYQNMIMMMLLITSR